MYKMWKPLTLNTIFDCMFLTLDWAILTVTNLLTNLLSLFMLSYVKHVFTPASYSHTQN